MRGQARQGHRRREGQVCQAKSQSGQLGSGGRMTIMIVNKAKAPGCSSIAFEVQSGLYDFGNNADLRYPDGESIVRA